MREIKFRGQDIKTKEWVYGFLVIKNEPIVSEMGVQYGIDDEVECEDNYYIYNEDDDRELIDNFIQIIPETVGQYTGLDDKNKVEIYEGSNIKKPDFKGKKGKIIIPPSYKIKYEDGGFFAIHDKQFFHLSCCVKDFEVVEVEK